MCGAQSSNTRQGGDCHESTKKVSMEIINYRKGSSGIVVWGWLGGQNCNFGSPKSVMINRMACM